MTENVLTPGARVLHSAKGRTQLGTVMSVTGAADFSPRGGPRGEELIIIVQLDDGTLVPAPMHRLSVADESQATRTFFNPAGYMERTEVGWELVIDWSDSMQGGVLAGVIVDDPRDIPESEAAGEALDAALKRSPFYSKGEIRVLISDPPPTEAN